MASLSSLLASILRPLPCLVAEVFSYPLNLILIATCMDSSAESANVEMAAANIVLIPSYAVRLFAIY